MDGTDIGGVVAPGWDGVRAEFAAVLSNGGGTLPDVQFAAFHRGEKVVDLWAGPDMTGDSLLGIYSASKGVAHLVVALLVQQGVLDLDERVATYWPEFAAEGKGDVRLRQLLAHQAGLVGVPEGLTLDELSDDRIVADQLARRHPFWRPGHASGYHALVVAALTGEVVRRATGRSVQEHVTDRFRKGLGVEVYLGLPAELDDRFLAAQPAILTAEQQQAEDAAQAASLNLAGVGFNRGPRGGVPVWELPNHETVRRRGVASFGGVATARALAELYAHVGTSVAGRPPLLDAGTRASFAEIQSVGFDLVLRASKAWAVGFHPVAELYPELAVGAFGHSGAGGQQAFVDPTRELSYAFLRRRGVPPEVVDAGHGRLVRALVAAATAR